MRRIWVCAPLLALLFFMARTGWAAADPKRPARTSVHVAAPELSPPLDPKQFKARIDTQDVAVQRALGPLDDLVLILVLDLTGDISLIEAARDAVAAQIGQLPPNVWLAVMKSQDALQPLVDPTPDRDAVLNAIRNYNAVGKAGLLTTVEGAAGLGDALLARSAVRVAVMYLTDSNIYNYREDYTNPVINASDSRDLSRKFPDQLIREKMQKLADSLASSETPLFFVHLSYFSDTINEAYQRGLLQVAGESGGAGAFCRSPGEIPSAVQRAFEQARNHWNVKLTLPVMKRRSFQVYLSNGDRVVPCRTRFRLRK